MWTSSDFFHTYSSTHTRAPYLQEDPDQHYCVTRTAHVHECSRSVLVSLTPFGPAIRYTHNEWLFAHGFACGAAGSDTNLVGTGGQMEDMMMITDDHGGHDHLSLISDRPPWSSVTDQWPGSVVLLRQSFACVLSSCLPFIGRLVIPRSCPSSWSLRADSSDSSDDPKTTVATIVANSMLSSQARVDPSDVSWVSLTPCPCTRNWALI